LAEIEEQSDFETAETQLGVELGAASVHPFLGRFGFDHDPLVYHETYPIGSLHQQSLTADIQPDLPPYLVPSQPERVRQAHIERVRSPGPRELWIWTPSPMTACVISR
jgi:hypothetical protein